MRRLFLLFSFATVINFATSQQGDFAIEISLKAPSVPLNGVTQLKVHICNNGAVGNNYVANSLRAVVSMSSNAEIIGISGISDSRWRLEGFSVGRGNSFRITNKGGTLFGNDCGDLLLDVLGEQISTSSTITSNIAFIAAINPLLNNGNGAPNATQGNTSVGNDNSLTTLAVTSAVAPVTLIDFTAKPKDNKVLLDWDYAGDNQFSHFEIKKSIDGVSFINLDNVQYAPAAAAIASGNQLHFNAVDDNPVGGNNYYKLKMIEKDGSYRYSEILKVNFVGNLKDVSVYPNPVVDIVTVKAPALQGTGRVKLYNVFGTLVAQYPAAATTKINLQALAQGSYMLELISAKGERMGTMKLLKLSR